jgi:uncharacterized membrane-anchored protein
MFAFGTSALVAAVGFTISQHAYITGLIVIIALISGIVIGFIILITTAGYCREDFRKSKEKSTREQARICYSGNLLEA